jgi:hypothetical protein
MHRNVLVQLWELLEHVSVDHMWSVEGWREEFDSLNIIDRNSKSTCTRVPYFFQFRETN